MKKLLLCLFLAVAASASAYAELTEMLSVCDKSGNIHLFDPYNVDFKLTDDGLLAISNNDGTKTFEMTELSTLYFYSHSGVALKTASAEDDGPIDVFTVTGIKAGTFATEAEAVNALERGIYICRHSNGRTSKIAVR